MTQEEERVLKDVHGVVKWFDPKRGFGFIIGPQGQDIFVHYTQIKADGFRVLPDGSGVIYDAELTERGWHASRVVRSESLRVRMAQKGAYARSPRR